MQKSQYTATTIGSIAIILWSTLALFTASSSSTPAFLLLSLTFGIATLIFLCSYAVKRELLRSWRQTPKPIMLFGGSAFFLYHYLYFYAFQHAPAVDAGLIAYLWPLFIVLLSGLSTKSLKKKHLVGALTALAGTCIIIIKAKGSEISRDDTNTLGYLAAFGCAIIWSGYSVINGKLKQVPSNAVVWYCAVTAVSASLAHIALEPTVNIAELPWGAIVALGIGPVGIAFFCWDYGVKNGNISLLGVLSYLAPALSTIWLALLMSAPMSIYQWSACGLITGGALIASLPLNYFKKIRLFKA